MPDRDSYETALRLIETLRQLPRYPKVITPRQLREQLAARGFTVDIRTIWRNLNQLSRYYPISNDEQKPQGWCWMRDADLTDLPRMDPATALAFRLARLHLASLLPATLLARFDPYLKAADRALGDSDLTYRWADKVRLSATVNDTSLLRWWLLGFGAGVEVLEPAALRQEMTDTARRMAWRYRPA